MTDVFTSPIQSGMGGADILLGLDFFEEHGLMPANTIREDLYTMPAGDFENFSVVTKSFLMSRLRTGGENPWNFGWDMGGEKTKVLFVLAGLKSTGTHFQLFMTDTLPTDATTLPNGTYMYLANGVDQAMHFYKHDSDVDTQLDVDGFYSIINNVAAYSGPTYGMAFYFDAAANRLVGLVKHEGGWIPILDITDASFSQFRYVGFRYFPFSGQRCWINVPLGIYAE